MKGRLTTKFQTDLIRKERLEGKGLENLSKSDLQALKKDLAQSLNYVNDTLNKL